MREHIILLLSPHDRVHHYWSLILSVIKLEDFSSLLPLSLQMHSVVMNETVYNRGNIVLTSLLLKFHLGHSDLFTLVLHDSSSLRSHVVISSLTLYFQAHFDMVKIGVRSWTVNN